MVSGPLPHLGYGHIIRDSTCSMRIGRDVTSIVAALYPVDVPHGVCVLYMNTSSSVNVFMYNVNFACVSVMQV